MEAQGATQDKVLTTLLRHPSVQDAAVLARLMASSQQLQQDVAAQSAGQGRLALTLKQLPQALQLSSWLQRHVHLLQELNICMDGGSDYWQQDAGEALAAPLEQQQAQLQLRSFSLSYAMPVNPISQLQPLPASSITKLSIGVQFCLHDDEDSSSNPNKSISISRQLAAVAALTNLRSLNLAGAPKELSVQWGNGIWGGGDLEMPTGQAGANWHLAGDYIASLDSYWTQPAKDAEAVLAPLAALTQFTELRLGAVNPGQLWQLPSSLQRLHFAVQLKSSKSEPLQQLASWLQQHGTKVVSLALRGPAPYRSDQTFAEYLAFEAAVAAVGEAFKAATTATAAVSRGHTAATAVAIVGTASRLQLSSLCLQALGVSCAPLLQQLPAGTPIKHLEGCLDFSRQAHVAAVARLAALQSLALHDAWQLQNEPGQAVRQRSDVALKKQLYNDDVLAPLSALQQLQHLHLQSAAPAHISRLPAQLKQLCVDSFYYSYSRIGLQLGHLTALSSFQVNKAHLSPQAAPLLPGTVLPPNLEDCVWNSWDEYCICLPNKEPDSVKPLLSLSSLRRLVLKADVSPPHTELQQLSKLPALTELQLCARAAPRLSRTLAKSLEKLPIRSLVWRERECISEDEAAPLEAACDGDAALDAQRFLQHMGALTQLTCLELQGPKQMRSITFFPTMLPATLAQLAANISPMTALRRLALREYILMGCEGVRIRGGVHEEGKGQQWNSCEGVETLVIAVAGLPLLRGLLHWLKIDLHVIG
jgi:hypothetical protein